MKSITIALVAITVLAAVEFLCLQDYHKTSAVTSGKTRMAVLAEWVETAPVPSALVWGLFGVTVVVITRAKPKT